MKLFTVHLRRHGLDPDRDLVVVKEGFSWPAFWLSFIWALRHRLWLMAAALVAISMAVNAAVWVLGLGPETALVLALGSAVLTGLLANDCRRWTLRRQGFAEMGVASGKTEDQALARFLDDSPDLVNEIL